MSESNDKKTELRGVFVLGIIGSLLALGRFADVKILFGMSLAELTNGLILFWGIYVALMAVGVSDDIVRPTIAKYCTILANFYFLGGLALLITIPFLVGFYDLFQRFGVNELLTVPIVVVLVLLFVLGLHRKGSIFS